MHDDAACDGWLSAHEGHHDYRYPSPGWPHAMPHLPRRINVRWRVYCSGVRLPYHHPAVEAVASVGPDGRLPPPYDELLWPQLFFQIEDTNACDAACDGSLPAPQGHPDYCPPPPGWTHAMPHMPTQLNPCGRVHRDGVRLSPHHPAWESVAAAGPDGCLPPHLRPVAVVSLVHADGGSQCT